MADESNVIREFLVKLGFTVDGHGNKKFGDALKSTTSLATNAGKAVVAVGLAAQAMVATFASSMEKMYYASRRTGASVDNLQAAEFGARNIGLAAGQSTEALESMAAAIRMNPGMRGLLNNILGKDTSGDDPTESMIELIRKLSTLPHAVGANFAQMFGIDERSFLMLKQGIDEYEAAYKKRKAMNAAAGLDGDAAARAAKEYTNMLRDIGEKLDIIRQKWSVEILPYAMKFAEAINGALDRLAQVKISDDIKAMLDGYERLFGDKKKPLVEVVKVPPRAEDAGKPWYRREWDDIKRGAGNLKKWWNGEKPTVTDDDRSVAPGKVDLRNMTPEQRRKVEALAEKQFAMRPGAAQWAGGPEWAARSEAYRSGQGARDAAQRELLQNEYVVETDPTRRAMMERFMRSVNVTPPTGTAERAAAAPAAGSAGTTVTQNNDIKIVGAEQQSALRDAQQFVSRMGADLTRNFKGAVR